MEAKRKQNTANCRPTKWPVDCPVDRRAQRAQGSSVDHLVDRSRRTFDRSGQPTGMHGVSVGLGRSTGRPSGWVSRPSGQPTDESTRICFSFQNSDFVSKLESNPIGFPKTLRLSDYK